MKFWFAFFKYFLGMFFFYGLVLIAFNILIQQKTLNEIDYILNIFIVTLFSATVGFSKARKEVSK